MRTITQRIYTGPKGIDGTDGDFICRQCGAFVCADEALSGVRNRNHCPYCLTSRHVDLFTAGDRLAACRGNMKPVGLTLKRERKRYPGQGELMIVHLCEDCGEVSINRIARDDSAEMLYSVLERSADLSKNTRDLFEQQGVTLLDTEQAHLVR